MTRRTAFARLGAALDRGPPPWLAWPLLVVAIGALMLASLGAYPGPIATSPGADPAFLRSLEQGYRDGWFMAWERDPERLAAVMDVEATRGFVARWLSEPTAAEGNLICAAYQLGMGSEDLPGWTRGQDWRHFWRYDPRPFSAYFLFGGGQPSAEELEAFTAASREQALALMGRGTPAGWDDRHGVVIALMGLRMAGAWPDPDLAPKLEDWARGPRDASHPWDPFVDALLCEVAELDCDHSELRRLVEESWDGTGFPDQGCGAEHCATKYLLNAVQLHYQLDWPLDDERCEGYLAGLVALQNPDGSFRVDLDDPRSSNATGTIGLYHCSSFCQLHLWEMVSSANWLMSRCEVDPERVARRVEALRAEGAR